MVAFARTSCNLRRMTMTCPNCGDAVPDQIALVAMVTCPSCGTTLYVDGARLRDAGAAGVLHDSPQLFGIGHTVRLDRVPFTVHGQARFSYGRGWWDEFWGLDHNGNGLWVSVDEGDIVLQTPLDDRPPIGQTSRVGQRFTYAGEGFRVVETGSADCTAVLGAFGERLLVGESYGYLNASGESGALLSGEFQGGQSAWFLGAWIDPFDVVIEAGP